MFAKSKKVWGGKCFQNPLSAILRLKKKVPTAIKLGGGEGLGLNGPAIGKRSFLFTASLRDHVN